MGESKRKVRVTLDLTAESYQRLTDLEERVGAPTKAAVLREALRLYEYIVKKCAEGNEFALLKDDKTKVVQLFSVPPH